MQNKKVLRLLDDARPGPELALSQIRTDLEGRGVSPDFSDSVAARLDAIAGDLTEHEYAAVLDGVAAAYGAHVDERARGDEFRNVTELGRLVEGFGGELDKLHEGLQILSAYVTRMSDRSGSDERSRVLH